METIKEEKKADLELLKLTIESREFKIKTLIEENGYWRGEAKKLKEELENTKKELQHYKNTEAIQKSNNASRYNPYNHKSYVDREFNVIP